jgi:hypothetical protein
MPYTEGVKSQLSIFVTINFKQKMKSIQRNTLIKKMLLGIAAALIVLTWTSCSKKISFMTSSVVPAARGYVRVKNDNNKNYAIEVHLSELAEVKRLQPAKNTYVVWMETDQQQTKNIGQINSSVNSITKKLKASFETVSSFKPIKIFITAEDEASVQYPGTQVVLSTDRF